MSRIATDCPGMSQDSYVSIYRIHMCILYHLPRSLCREPSLLPIKRGWSFTMHSAPPSLLMGGAMAAPQTGLPSCEIGDIGYPRTVLGNLRHMGV